MNSMTYKQYNAVIEYSEEDGCFIGHLAGIRDIVGFHGESVSELKLAFEEAVEDYLETCQKLNRAPQTPDETNLILRLPSKIYAAIGKAAEARGISINQWAIDMFAHTVG